MSRLLTKIMPRGRLYHILVLYMAASVFCEHGVAFAQGDTEMHSLIFNQQEQRVLSKFQASNPVAVSSLEKLVEESVIEIINQFEEENYRAFKFFVTEKAQEIRNYEKLLDSSSKRMEEARLVILKFLETWNDRWQDIQEMSYLSAVLSNPFLSLSPLTIGQLRLSDKLQNLQCPLQFKTDPQESRRVFLFLRQNVTRGGMPLSFYAPEGYWRTIRSLMDEVDSVLERLLVKYSLSVYDGALWQIAMTITGDAKDRIAVDQYTQRLINGRSGELYDIRAYGPLFKYGKKKVVLSKQDGAYFFRIIADEYLQEDPLDQGTLVDNFPNFRYLHHEDWKPITGEQAWAAIIGPLQVAYIKYGGNIPMHSPEVRLALSMLPAIELMQSDIGAIYHAPEGTSGKNPDDISNENNFSMYAALRMLYDVVKTSDLGTAVRIEKIFKAQEEYFRKYAFDREHEVFYQGGFYSNDRFSPTKIFAADCQTWGIIALGPRWVDREFGEGASYRIWQNTKARAACLDREGKFIGTGFTDGHRIISIEWTCGMILTGKIMAKEYENSHPSWSRKLNRDIVFMRYGIEEFKMKLKNGSSAYLYANDRYFIPFGWWANPLPSAASSVWVLLNDFQFNPFILGGGPDFNLSKTHKMLGKVYASDQDKDESIKEELPKKVIQNLKHIKQLDNRWSKSLARNTRLQAAGKNGKKSSNLLSPARKHVIDHGSVVSNDLCLLQFLWQTTRFLVAQPSFHAGEKAGLIISRYFYSPKIRFDHQKFLHGSPYGPILSPSSVQGAFHQPLMVHNPSMGTRLFQNQIEEESSSD